MPGSADVVRAVGPLCEPPVVVAGDGFAVVLAVRAALAGNDDGEAGARGPVAGGVAPRTAVAALLTRVLTRVAAFATIWVGTTRATGAVTFETTVAAVAVVFRTAPVSEATVRAGD